MILLRILLGPFSPGRSIPGATGALLLVALLTVLTQIGGLVLWLAYGIGAAFSVRSGRRQGLATLAAFALLYAVATLAVVPWLAAAYDRVPLSCIADAEHRYEANSILYCVLNRHYVRPEARRVLETLSAELARAYPGTIVSTLDAGLPFLEAMPMIPHWTHRDGRSVDIALFYEDAMSDEPKPKGGAWPVGYWAFAPAWALAPGEARGDPRDGVMRWTMTWLQGLFSGVDLDRKRTAALVRLLTEGAPSDGVRRVLIEPYLERALGLDSPKAGFAGWRAGRHDDHVHIFVY